MSVRNLERECTCNSSSPSPSSSRTTIQRVAIVCFVDSVVERQYGACGLGERGSIMLRWTWSGCAPELPCW